MTRCPEVNMVLDRMLMILHDYRVVYLNDDLIFVFIYNLTRIVCIYNIEWMMVFIQKPHNGIDHLHHFGGVLRLEKTYYFYPILALRRIRELF